ncbi:IS3 family transposase, partial [Micromonospora olivasterospora]
MATPAPRSRPTQPTRRARTRPTRRKRGTPRDDPPGHRTPENQLTNSPSNPGLDTWSTLKIELVYRTSWRTRDEPENAIFAYIDGWYNTRRIQKELGYRSPDEYETAWHTHQKEPAGQLSLPLHQPAAGNHRSIKAGGAQSQRDLGWWRWTGWHGGVRGRAEWSRRRFGGTTRAGIRAA